MSTNGLGGVSKVKIKFNEDCDKNMVMTDIVQALNLAGINATYSVNGKLGKLHRIRRQESKVYCGSHPFACDIEGTRKAKYLHGSEWVAVNDVINDVLDAYELSANVDSVVCIIRKGRERRLSYDGYAKGRGYEWEKDCDDFADYCGSVAPRSEFPEGTP